MLAFKAIKLLPSIQILYIILRLNIFQNDELDLSPAAVTYNITVLLCFLIILG